MDNNSQLTTRSRQDILDTVRSRYIQKFGREASPTIETSIKKLASKHKVSLQDFNQIEDEIK